MSDSHTPTPTEPGPLPPNGPTGTDRFWAWIHGLGVTRADGWLGGVCAGIAVRLRIDPAIVRGIVVVAAILGFPMLLLYAVAWALLPDTAGRIHLRELFRGHFDPTVVGIGILLIVSVVPVVPWLSAVLLPQAWPFGGWGSGWAPLGLIATVLGLALVLGVVFLIARSSRRTQTPGDSEPAPRRAFADAGAPGPAAASEGAGAAADLPAPPGPEPIAPEPGAGDAGIADWRAQHDEWRTRNEAWRRSQQDAERLAREQARREREAANAAFAVEVAERRRIDRLSRPRASGAFVAVTVGTALIVGATAALFVVVAGGAGNGTTAAPGFGDRAFATAIGIFAAAVVVALGMVVAGSVRRRSGFLAFITVVLLISGTGAAAAPPVITEISSWNHYVTNRDGLLQTIVQRRGQLSIDLRVLGANRAAAPITVHKGHGGTTIDVGSGVELELHGQVAQTQVSLLRWPQDGRGAVEGSELAPDSDGVVLARLSDPNAPVVTRQPVFIEQDGGSITVRILSSPTAAPSPTATPSPIPTPEVTP